MSYIKGLMLLILIYLLVLGVCIIGGMVVEGTWDIARWDSDTRGATVGISVVLMFWVLCSMGDEK